VINDAFDETIIKSKQLVDKKWPNNLFAAETTTVSANQVVNLSTAEAEDCKQTEKLSDIERKSHKRNLSEVSSNSEDLDSKPNSRRHKGDHDNKELYSLFEPLSEHSYSENLDSELLDIEAESCCKDLIKKM